MKRLIVIFATVCSLCLISLISLLVCGCLPGQDSAEKPDLAEKYEKVIKETQLVFYQLGRNTGALAYATKNLEMLKSGKQFTTDEVYQLADEIVEMTGILEAN